MILVEESGTKIGFFSQDLASLPRYEEILSAGLPLRGKSGSGRQGWLSGNYGVINIFKI
jgi:hypothetical protein